MATLVGVAGSSTLSDTKDGPVVLLKPGDRAKALWKMGRKFYNVDVVAANEDGTYSLVYEDGDRWENVPADRITTVSGEGLVPDTAVASVGLEPTKLRHSVAEGSVDSEMLARIFPQIKAIFKPQIVKYSNTNPDIAAEDGGAHGEKIDWKVSSYMEVDTSSTPGAAQRGVTCDLELKALCMPLLDKCNAVFTSWYERQHGAGSVKALTRLQSFVTRYRPFPNENALLRHIDGAHVDGSVILALPTDFPFEGGGVTVWERQASKPSSSKASSSKPSSSSKSSSPSSSAVAEAAVPAGDAQGEVAAAGKSSGGGGSGTSSQQKPHGGTKSDEVSFEYPLHPGDMCLLDNYVWHQGNPITAGERWSLVIFYAVQEPSTSRLLNIVKKAADAKLREDEAQETSSGGGAACK